MLHTGRLGKSHFSLEKQVAMIQGHGTTVIIQPVLQCPCLRAERQFDPLCHSCHGTGRLYRPEATYTTTLLMHQEASAREFQEPGTWLAGSIRASVLPGVRLCERDKVRMVDIRDVANDEALCRGIDDTVRFTSGIQIDLIADLATAYRPGIDYTLTPPHTIQWVAGGNAPAFGAPYSVRYSYYPEYLIVNDSPRLRVEHRVPQSQEVIMLRLDKLSEDF